MFHSKKRDCKILQSLLCQDIQKLFLFNRYLFAQGFFQGGPYFVSEDICSFSHNVFNLKNFNQLKRNFGFFEWNIFINKVSVFYRQHGYGSFGFLCNLKNSVVKWEHFSSHVSCSLGVNSNGKLTLFQKL